MTPERPTAESNATKVTDQTARIGPNAIIRLAEAIDSLHGKESTRAVFDAAGQLRHLDQPPDQLVDEADVIALYRTCGDQLGPAPFAKVTRLAGQLTGDYVLHHRIPGVARALLPRLPKAIAARILAKAISAHAWTFVGSGRFSHQCVAGGLTITIANSPLARGQRSAAPVCHFYAATFERIFQSLIDRRTRVTESACCAMGAEVCHFSARFDGALAAQPAA